MGPQTAHIITSAKARIKAKELPVVLAIAAENFSISLKALFSLFMYFLSRGLNEGRLNKLQNFLRVAVVMLY